VTLTNDSTLEALCEAVHRQVLAYTEGE
jgi:hypothetical protein